MMVPEADQVNTSICPGVSIKTYLKNHTIDKIPAQAGEEKPDRKPMEHKFGNHLLVIALLFLNEFHNLFQGTDWS